MSREVKAERRFAARALLALVAHSIYKIDLEQTVRRFSSTVSPPLTPGDNVP